MNHRISKIAGWTTVLLAGFPCVATHAQSAGPTAPDSELVSAARAVAMELGGKLKGQLEAALKADGPVAALGVCKTVAPAIASDLASTYGGKVGRTALKVRNPANTADDFEKEVLQRFIAEGANGADISKLEHAEVVEQEGKRVFRYVKAIPMAATPCAACHGTAVAPELLQTIRDLYPDDQAVGFSPGEIRGAFTITKPLP